MSQRRILYILTFIESFATILLERGIYFFSHQRLHFTEEENLGLAFSFGVLYVAGALLSHRAAARWGERRLLSACLGGLLLAQAVLPFFARGWVLAVVFPGIAFLTGMKWPLVESYVSAGLVPREVIRVVGRFNVSWASAVPLAVAATGPLIDVCGSFLIMVAAGINVVSLFLVRWLAARPVHLPDDHPERPSPERIALYRRHLASSRWSMIASYSLLFLLVPLMPEVFARLGVGIRSATLYASLLDAVRVTTFFFLGVWVGWHGRAVPMVLALLGLPVGFYLALFGVTVPQVLAGEILFGAAAGMTYYAALYYALVLENASVNAGGDHEGLIGGGFALGPLLGLGGLLCAGPLGGDLAGMVAVTGPFILCCVLGAARPLLAAPQEPV